MKTLLNSHNPKTTQDQDYQYNSSKFDIKITKSSRPSLVDLIVVVADLTVLTSIISTTFTSIFSDFESDEVQAHLNSLTADCLKEHRNLANSNAAMPTPASADTNLPSKNNYEENRGNNCKYFQVNPKDSTSKTHFSMGFGISYGNVTKFAIKDLPIQGVQLS